MAVGLLALDLFGRQLASWTSESSRTRGATGRTRAAPARGQTRTTVARIALVSLALTRRAIRARVAGATRSRTCVAWPRSDRGTSVATGAGGARASFAVIAVTTFVALRRALRVGRSSVVRASVAGSGSSGSTVARTALVPFTLASRTVGACVAGATRGGTRVAWPRSGRGASVATGAGGSRASFALFAVIAVVALRRALCVGRSPVVGAIASWTARLGGLRWGARSVDSSFSAVTRSSTTSLASSFVVSLRAPREAGLSRRTRCATPPAGRRAPRAGGATG